MFPPEIFCEIFSFLTSEASVLLACSQAHPIFAQLIEPSLYAHVFVHNHEADDNGPTSPPLSHHVISETRLTIAGR